MYDMSPFCATLWAEAHFSSDCEIQLGFTGGKRTCLPMQETQEMRVRSLGWEDSPGEGNGYPLQYSYLENSMDRGV